MAHAIEKTRKLAGFLLFFALFAVAIYVAGNAGSWFASGESVAEGMLAECTAMSVDADVFADAYRRRDPTGSRVLVVRDRIAGGDYTVERVFLLDGQCHATIRVKGIADGNRFNLLLTGYLM